jgi:hypothetical protein
MSSTLDTSGSLQNCGGATSDCTDGSTAGWAPLDGKLIPDNPFLGLNYHFGMLLGVDDLETEQGFHHGKMRLHNAWLHRAGVVWGLGVGAELATRELQVQPGLALDGAGHEVHVDLVQCVDVGQWFDEHKDDPDFDPQPLEDEGGDSGFSFTATVELSYRACLTRPVPAISQPCIGADLGAGSDTAYSRVYETFALQLVGGPSPDRDLPYRRLRLLFGLDVAPDPNNLLTAVDQSVADELATIAALPASDQEAAFLSTFRTFAALDGIDLQPATDADGNLLLFPFDETHPIVLATAAITLTGTTGAWTLASCEIDTSVRPAHVATATIQELTIGGDSDEVAASSGTRVSACQLAADGSSVTLTFTAALDAPSVQDEAFSVSLYSGGWSDSKLKSSLDTPTQVTLALKSSVTLGDTDVLRVIALGTGPHPLLDTTLSPLTGNVSGPASPADEGHDSVTMIRKGN